MTLFTRRPRAWLPAAVALVLLGGVHVRASSAQADLLQLIPDDVSLCLAVTDLRSHAEKGLAAPWLKKLLDSPFAQTLASAPEVRKLTQLDRDLQKRLQVSLAQMRDDIFGDAVVFAYRAAPAGKPEQERGLLLLSARDSALLARLVDGINKEQKNTGELKTLEARDYRGVRYYRREEVKGDRFYLVRGPLLAYSATESMLRQVIDRQTSRSQSHPPAGPARQLLRLGADKALLTLWLNPRAFDEELRAKAAKSEGAAARLLQGLLKCWPALDGVALTLRLDRDLELRLSVQGRPQDCPAPIRQLLENCCKPAEIWSRFPEDSIVTVAGRLDLAAVYAVLGEFMTAEDRTALGQQLQRTAGAALGMDVVDDVLPHVGPDWGLCVTTAPGGGAVPHALVAVRVRQGNKDTPVDQSVNKAIQFFVGLAVFDYNRTHKVPIQIKGAQQGSIEVKFLACDSAFPPGFQPALALKGGYLVLGSSPEALTRFAGEPTIKMEPLLFRLSVTELARVLQTHRRQVAEYLSRRQGISAAAADQWLDGLLWAASFVDRVELSEQTQTGQASWALRFRLAPPSR